MKTTVKDFILDNLTDKNFEKLVNTLVEENIRYICLNEDNIIDATSNYLNNQNPCYTKDNTFEILNEIKKVSMSYVTDYKDDILLADGLKPLNDTTMSWMPVKDKVKVEENSEESMNTTKKVVGNLPDKSLEFEPELPFKKTESSVGEVELEIDELEIAGVEKRKGNAEYLSFQDIKIALIPEGQMSYEAKLPELSIENYKEFLQKNKIQTTLALLNFIYEVFHYSNESKLENKFKEFSNETSHVKITNSPNCTSDYSINFLLDNRSRYAPSEEKKAYYKRSEKSTDSEGRHNLPYFAWDFPVSSPDFLEYEELVQDLEWGPEYILAPFTFYLNEDIVVPKVSDDVLYEILGQVVHVLTFQGFIKEDQLNCIKYFNESYVLNIV